MSNGPTPFPSPEVVLEMEPEELAPHVLRDLRSQSKGSLNRHNYTLVSDMTLSQQLGPRREQYAERLMEAWMYLEREGFLAPKPGDQGNWAFITRKGERIVDEDGFDAYRHASLFPAHLDPVLARTVRPLFLRGDYDTAVFRAFKEVEVRVRKKGRFTNDDYGVDLMKKAFGPTGPLTDTAAPKGEQDRRRDLFVGCIGSFKNPSSHRDVAFDDPTEVVDAICVANQLLRIVERS